MTENSTTDPQPAAPIPPLAQARVVGPYAQTAIDTAAERGLSPARLAVMLGMPPESLAPATESLSVERYIRLLETAATACGDPLFGLHVGERTRLSTFAVYGLVLCSCRSFRAATEQTRRFEGLAHDLGRSRIEEHEMAPAGPPSCGGRPPEGAQESPGRPVASLRVAHYVWESPWLAALPCRHLAESVMAGILSFANWLAHARVPVIDVAFAHRAPDPALIPAYEQFFDAPVRFDAPQTCARFPAEILDWPVPNADVSLFPVLARHAEQLLAAREREARQPEIINAVREKIVALLAHDCARLGDVADALGNTPRTLQRKLAEAGTRYQTVLDATRRELAEQYLREPGMTMTEVAFLLGYREQSSFNHAFRDWYGTTPAAWREQALNRP